MRQNKIKDIIEKDFKKISGHYRDIRNGFDIDDIHNFRTKVKNLRSFIRMLHSVPDTDQLGIPPKFKSIYTYLGAIRTLQLQSEHVQDICNKMSVPPPDAYLGFLASQEQAWKKKTGEKMDGLSIDQQEQKILKQIPSYLHKKHIKDFITDTNRKLHILFALPLFYDEALHDIRKRLKDLHYNWKYIEDNISLLSPSYLTNAENIKLLTDKFGDFHDHSVTLHLLESIYTRRVREARETDTLQAIIDRLQTEKQDRKADLIRHILQLGRQSRARLEVNAEGIVQKSMLEV